MIGDFDYAQARMQARFGARASANAWTQAHAAKSLDAFLETARRSALAAWIAALETESTQEGREGRLRERLRGRIAELASWLPEPWREAMRWTARLVDLPAIQYLASGRPAWPWMRGEATLAAPLREGRAPERPQRLLDEWLAAWRERWPAADAGERAGLERLVTTVRGHLEAFPRSPPRDAWDARERFERSVVRIFREEALAPAAAFAYVVLAALEAERVRAELVTRAASGASS